MAAEPGAFNQVRDAALLHECQAKLFMANYGAGLQWYSVWSPKMESTAAARTRRIVADAVSLHSKQA